MRQNSGLEGPAEKHEKEIRRKTWRSFSVEEKICILIEDAGCVRRIGWSARLPWAMAAETPLSFRAANTLHS